ncbi:MAG TPA: FtsX-like permease family protein [Verrucomicrobiae bacterium]
MSKLPFELLLALRYLRPKRTFVAIITLISIIGVSLGVAVLIIVISVMSGFDHDLREKILGFNPHLTIMQLDPDTGAPVTMTDHLSVAKVIQANPDVIGVSPYVMGPVLLETEGGTNQPSFQDTPILRGMDPNNEAKTSQLSKQVIAGDFDLSGRGLVVGADFAQNLHLQPGDHVSIYSAREIKRMKEAYDRKEYEAIAPMVYEIRGIFDTGYYDFDSKVVISSLSSAQDLYDLEDSVHGLVVTVKDPYQVTRVENELIKSLGNGFRFRTWMEDNAPLLSAVVVEKGMMYYLMFFIVIVASFGITCTLITFVILKTRDIGIMKAVGATNFQVMSIFVIQSVIVSVMGIVLGLGLGLFALHVRNDFLRFMNHLTGADLFSPIVYHFNELPALISPSDIAIICGGSLVICLAAAILPAHYASRLKPVEALRYE